MENEVMRSAGMKLMQETMEKQKYQTIENYRRLNRIAKKGGILFTGSSLMEQFPVSEFCITHGLGKIVYNRGVGSFRTDDFIHNIHEMLLDLEPSKVFINIGTNDICVYEDGTPWEEKLEARYDYILGQCKEKLPAAKVYMMAYYPMDELNEENQRIGKMFGSIRSNGKLEMANGIVRKLAEKYGYRYIDVNQGLTLEDGNLKPEYSKDGIHMYADAYEQVFLNLLPYILEN